MTIIEHLKDISAKINDEFAGTFVNKIFSPTKDTFVLKFSHSKDKTLVISLNSENPFVCVSTYNGNFSVNSNFLNKLKIKLLNSHLVHSDILNDDNILSLEFRKTTDTYDKITYFVYVELFKANSNIIFVSENKVVDAFRFRGLESHHPIIGGLIYLPPKKNNFVKEYKENNFENIFLQNLENKYLSEKYGDILIKIKRKIKSLSTKLLKLNIEKKCSQDKLKYKEYGDILLSSIDEINKGDLYFEYEGEKIFLKENYTPVENSQYYYKQYKKAKISLQTIDTYIKETEGQIDYLSSLLNTSTFYHEQDFIDLIDELNDSKLVKIKSQKPTILKKNPAEPYYFFYNSTKLGFGKNANQNNILTFKKAIKNSYFIHAVEGSGAHVIIFDDNPSNEVIEIASSVALFLSKKTDGDVYYTNIKNVKKSSIIGKVNLLDYKTYHLNKLTENIENLILNANRF